MIKVKDVSRNDTTGIVERVVFEYGNVSITFVRPGPKGESSRFHDGQVYDKHNTYIPKQEYSQMIKMSYGIFSSKGKPKVYVQQWLPGFCA
jgi:hypothetical protein